jgi:hypothetical protein
MSYADNVRSYCKKNYIDPARKSGVKTVEIISGDVHRAMNYKNRYPLVCSSIGASKFEELCHVRLIAIEGPSQGATTLFRFELI